MDKLKAIESFVSVATRGSLTAAANAEGVAPALMGRRLDALEAHLGVKLMVRTTRRISLTTEGSAYLEDCQRCQGISKGGFFLLPRKIVWLKDFPVALHICNNPSKEI